MKYENLGTNIQVIRKMKGYTQQELADKIGLNLQSLSKIERGVNYPTYETLEKIMDVLDVAPNELLSGILKASSHIETRIIDFIKKEEELNVELAYGSNGDFLDKEDFEVYEMEKLREYIINYINSEKRVAADLYPLKEFIQHQKFKKVIARYDDYLCADIFEESLHGYKNPNPYAREVREQYHINEDGEQIHITEYPDDFED